MPTLEHGHLRGARAPSGRFGRQSLVMTVARERLANCRNHWIYRFQSGDQHFTGGIRRFPDGRIAEIFINGSKVGSAAVLNAQDAAIIVSLALQHGCPIDTIRHALIRTGGTGGPVAALLNEVEGYEAG